MFSFLLQTGPLNGCQAQQNRDSNQCGAAVSLAEFGLDLFVERLILSTETLVRHLDLVRPLSPTNRVTGTAVSVFREPVHRVIAGGFALLGAPVKVSFEVARGAPPSRSAATFPWRFRHASAVPSRAPPSWVLRRPSGGPHPAKRSAVQLRSGSRWRSAQVTRCRPPPALAIRTANRLP